MIPPIVLLIVASACVAMAVIALVFALGTWWATEAHGRALGRALGRLRSLEEWRASMSSPSPPAPLRTRPAAPPPGPGGRLDPAELRAIDPDGARRAAMAEVLEQDQGGAA